ncbi:MAG TPA: hypothetical protein VIM11_26945 [Tepidisphaeraceae bacterium]
MRHAAGESPDRLHFLGLNGLFVARPPFGQVSTGKQLRWPIVPGYRSAAKFNDRYATLRVLNFQFRSTVDHWRTVEGAPHKRLPLSAKQSSGALIGGTDLPAIVNNNHPIRITLKRGDQASLSAAQFRSRPRMFLTHVMNAKGKSDNSFEKLRVDAGKLDDFCCSFMKELGTFFVPLRYADHWNTFFELLYVGRGARVAQENDDTFISINDREIEGIWYMQALHPGIINRIGQSGRDPICRMLGTHEHRSNYGRHCTTLDCSLIHPQKNLPVSLSFTRSRAGFI